MGLFYRREKLCLGTEAAPVALEAIAAAAAAPFYAYDWNEFQRRLAHFRESFGIPVEIHYAMKANGNPRLLARIAALDVGVDVVSGGELREAREAGFAASEIIFSGVGKTKTELTLAIAEGIKQINVESPQELARIGELARAAGKRARVAFRINPDVDPDTHPYITTGFRENKFGMDESFLPELERILAEYPRELELKGTTIHIGSQLLDLAAIESAIQKTIPIFERFRRAGHPVETFDIGGGLGVNYKADDSVAVTERMRAYGKIVTRLLKPLGCRVLCEPGRVLIGPAGVLVGEVQYVKQTPFKNFLIIDTGMHHLIRPSLYQAYHRILPIESHDDRPKQAYDVVGPICESSDVLGAARELPEMRQGERVAIADAGAYGFSMASHYNSHEMPLEFLVEDGKFTKI